MDGKISRSFGLILILIMFIFLEKSVGIFGYWRISFYLWHMDTEKLMVQEAKELLEYLCESVQKVFVGSEVLDRIDAQDEVDFREKVFPYLSSTEREWYDMVDGFIDEVSDFIISNGG